VRPTDLGDIEAGDVDMADAPGQALRDSPDEARIGASQDQELRARPWPIGKNPQDFKQDRHSLDFVDDDESAKRFERRLRCAEARYVARILEVEECGTPALSERAGKCRLT
jgi:hypothetical protein